jgi:hypothetical protein
MKAEIRFAQNDVLDDAKEDTETNMFEEAETRMWIYGQYDDAEEEAETKGGTATEQKESFADEEERKMTLVRKKMLVTGRKMMRMRH